ncbi:hypothetical protein [Wolbachia endosymbiont (group A) of Colletes cunicularius]|uniref:hypothetical protein n=1 Tax=Wolbachia endosymbiont (group A) of Colletes cunicularius TaxID=3139321 RepID=UPI0035C9094B
MQAVSTGVHEDEKIMGHNNPLKNTMNANSGLRKEESIGNRRLCGFDGVGNESRKDMNKKGMFKKVCQTEKKVIN